MVTKISFPSMGWSKIAFTALYDLIPGVEVFPPPPVTRDIVELGSKYSPEFVCLPFKITIGEFLNMIINHDVHTFIMSIDCGPCRLGFYAPIQERIIHDLGYEVTIIPIQQDDLWSFEWFDPYRKLSSVTGNVMKYVDMVNAARLAWIKAAYIEDIIRYEGIIRCREIKKGDTTKVVQKLMDKLDNERNFANLHRFDQIIRQKFRNIPIDREKQPLRIMIAGENHVVLEPYVNMDIMKKFGDEGVEVHITNSLYDWILHKLHLNYKRKHLERIAKPYIPMDIGGEAIWVIGYYLEAQSQGFDGFVHIYPFTCMPEVSARGILEGQSPDPFYLPIQFYSLDEHTGYEGMRTRLEAFIDLMKTNRDHNPKFHNVYQKPPEIEKIYGKPEKHPQFNNFIENFFNPLCKLLAMQKKPPKNSNLQAKTINQLNRETL
jgi:predicted nucleotide-binding protein (sugar kinase/HSP70/actin superfamily)